MFSLRRPTAAAVEQSLAAALRWQTDGPGLLRPQDGAVAAPGWAHDRARTHLGEGDEVFQRACAALRAWTHFSLGWVCVANPAARIEPGQPVAVEARTLGLWTLNISRIVQVVDEPGLFGFVYATTAHHVERGEERFLLRREPTGVWYELEAISRPRAPLARLGLPVTRQFQHRFARESLRQMRAASCADG